VPRTGSPRQGGSFAAEHTGRAESPLASPKRFTHERALPPRPGCRLGWLVDRPRLYWAFVTTPTARMIKAAAALRPKPCNANWWSGSFKLGFCQTWVLFFLRSSIYLPQLSSKSGFLSSTSYPCSLN
jgi:hypothetical protein